MIAYSLIFTYIYYEMRETRLALRLFQLIECKNRIMCGICKIVCLEKLKASGAINHI